MKRYSYFAAVLILGTGFGASNLSAHAQTAPPARTPPSASAPAPAAVKIDPDKEKAIRELMEITGAAKTSLQVIAQSIEAQRKGNPQIPAAFWDRFSKKITEKELTEITIPIYDRHYTLEDIQGMIALYKTPLGQKMLAVSPQVVDESMAAGQALGEEMATRVIREMQRENPDSVPAKKSVTPAPRKKPTGTGGRTAGPTGKAKP